MPLTPAELRELRQELQVTVERLRALRDLVVEVYGADNRAAESFMQVLENIRRVQQLLAKPAAPAARPPQTNTATSGALAGTVEFAALSYLADSTSDDTDVDTDVDTGTEDDDTTA